MRPEKSESSGAVAKASVRFVADFSAEGARVRIYERHANRSSSAPSLAVQSRTAVMHSRGSRKEASPLSVRLIWPFVPPCGAELRRRSLEAPRERRNHFAGGVRESRHPRSASRRDAAARRETAVAADGQTPPSASTRGSCSSRATSKSSNTQRARLRLSRMRFDATTRYIRI